MAVIVAKGQITITNLNDGVGITSVVEEYYLSTSSTELIGGAWSTTAPTPLKGTYVWARTRITFSDGSVTVTNPVRITGEGGVDGSDAYTVILTNECHSVLCNSAGTPNTGELGSTGRAYTDIIVYRGIEKLTAVLNTATPGTGQFNYSISTTTGGTSARKDNDTFYLNTMTASVSSINIDINIENKQTVKKVMSITKSIAGVDGNNGTNASFVNIVSNGLFFKCLSNSSVYTPSTITLMPVFVNSVYSLWQYSTDGSTWVDVVSGQNGLTISDSASGNVLTISNSCNLFTSLLTSVSFKVKGSYSTYDVTTIAKLKDGDTGANGTNGISITSVDMEYYLSTSKTSATGGTWQTTAPTWIDERYMWTRTKTTYSGGATSYTNPVCMGELGTGVSAITEEYYLSTSKTSQTGGTWSTTPPTWSPKTYLWTRSKIVYKNPTSTAYTTAVCDSSWEAVNQIQIGGRNLMRNGAFISPKDIDNLGVSLSKGDLIELVDITSDNIGFTTALHCKNTSVKNNGITYAIFPNKSSELLGKQITLSCYVKYLGVTQGANSWNVFNVGKFSFSYTNTDDTIYKDYPSFYNFSGDSTGWVKLEKTMTVKTGYKDASGSVQFFLEGCIGEFWVTGIKIEYGNKATDWTPSTDDVNESINSAVASVDVMYYLSTSNSSLSGGSWSTVAPTWVDGKFMWSKTVTTFKSGATSESSPTCIAGATGSTGNGIKTIKEQYYLSSSSTTTIDGSWLDSSPAPVKGKYIWTRSIITYTNNDSVTTDPIRSTGDAGVDGQNGVNILLDNENHTFVATSNGNAVVSNIVVNIFGFSGATPTACTIGTITGTPTGMTITPSGSGTTAAKLTIAVTTSMNTRNGVVVVPITCNGITINKNFTFSLAVAGSNGSNAKSADIIPTSKIFKSTDGGVSFSPNTITLNQVLQNVSFSKWQFSVDGGGTWNDVVSGQNGLTIASNNLTISKDSVIFTRDVTSISFKLITSDATIYDTETISKVYDVTDLTVGARNLIRNGTWNLGINKYWTTNTNFTVIEPEQDKDTSFILRYTKTGLTTASNAQKWSKEINIERDISRRFTISFDFKTADKSLIDSNKMIACIRMFNDLGKTSQTDSVQYINLYTTNFDSQIINGKWTRISYTFIPTSGKYIRIAPYATMNGDISWREFKLEMGNKATEYTPSFDDVIDELYESLGSSEAHLKQDFDRSFVLLENRIEATVKETNTMKDNIVDMKQEFESKVVQTSKDLTTTFTEANTALVGDLQAYKEEVQTMIRQSATGIEIGKTGSPFTTELSNSKLAFKENGDEVAYISNKEMNITNAIIKNQLTLGSYQFKPRSNGNMSLIWKV